jgi:hypothetical protein
MSSLTTLPKGDSAWLLRKSIQRVMQQVSVLETNIGSSTTGNSSNTQVIFNDNGTLRGDAGLTYNAATDTLTAGAATITGNLTVDTNTFFVDAANNRVGVLNTPTVPFEVTGLIAASGSGFQAGAANGIFAGLNNDGINPGLDLRRWTGTANNHGTAYIATSSSGDVLFYTDAQASNTRATTLRMTLDSTGLGVGGSPQAKIHAIDSGGVCALFTRAAAPATALSAVYIQAPVSSGFSSTPVLNFWFQNTGISNPASETLSIRTNSAERIRYGSDGNAYHSLQGAVPAIPNNGEMVFNFTSNTNLRISARGSDGVTRVANITLA